MSRQLKRWESPRREGRNHKGRGGAARQRQKRKQFQALRQKLKDQSIGSGGKENQGTTNSDKKGKLSRFPFLLNFLLLKIGTNDLMRRF